MTRLAVDVVTIEWGFCRYDRRWICEGEVILPAGTEVKAVVAYRDGDGFALHLPGCELEQWEVRGAFDPACDLVTEVDQQAVA